MIGKPHLRGHRSRSLMGTFGAVEISVPRARIEAPDGKTTEWRSSVLRDEHTTGSPSACRAVPRGRVQGYGQPDLAEGQDRLGGLEPALAGR